MEWTSTSFSRSSNLKKHWVMGFADCRESNSSNTCLVRLEKAELSEKVGTLYSGQFMT